MLANTLNTNEIKDRSGNEQEFARLSTSERSTEFALITETPSLPFRFNVKHVEIGSGIDKRRRSVIRFDKTVAGEVDTTKPAVDSAYIVLDTNVGNHTSYNNAKDVLAALTSFVATVATSTIALDGTGNGAGVLLSGGL
jgi:hypothetical protein